MLLQTIIFITGAAILALELLASRIMTPYFGVSLYIWSGILSITLISLAFGYWWGGILARGTSNNRPDTAKLTFLFAMMPPLAALALVVACLTYPYLFHAIARIDLVIGAFIAGITLLFIPLLTTSAMNPLLVAILIKQVKGATADADAGKVFFVSTIGSVAGVLITAFWLIPRFSNFVSVLLIAVTLAILPIPLFLYTVLTRTLKITLVTLTAAALTASLGLLINADAYIGHIWTSSERSYAWTLEAEYRSMFGSVKVLNRLNTDNDGFERMYFQDGLVQNIVDAQNRSVTLYTHALEALAYLYRPDMRQVLVLGNGAGVVPMRLAANQSIKVTTVDINPAGLQAAIAHFRFDPGLVKTVQADARTFLHACNNAYDVVIIDLFYGDGVPEYLATRDMFKDLKNCLVPNGVAIFNSFVLLDQPRLYAHFLATVHAELPQIKIYRSQYEGPNYINSFVVAAAQPLPPTAPNLGKIPTKTGYERVIYTMLKAPISLNQDLLAGGLVVTDAHNPATADLALSQLIDRRYTVRFLPMALFLN